MTIMFLNNVLGKMYFFFFNNIFLGKSTASVAFFLMSIFCCRSLSFRFIFFNTLLALLLKTSLQVSWCLTSFATKSIFYILKERYLQRFWRFELFLLVRWLSCILQGGLSFSPFLVSFSQNRQSGGNTPFLLVDIGMAENFYSFYSTINTCRHFP